MNYFYFNIFMKDDFFKKTRLMKIDSTLDIEMLKDR